MSSNPGWVELEVRSTSALSCTWAKNVISQVIRFEVILHWWHLIFDNALSPEWTIVVYIGTINTAAASDGKELRPAFL